MKLATGEEEWLTSLSGRGGAAAGGRTESNESRVQGLFSINSHDESNTTPRRR